MAPTGTKLKLVVPVTLKRDQEVRLTFNGSAGQSVCLGVHDVDFGTESGSVQLSLLSPVGKTLVQSVVVGSGASFAPEPLPAAGAYTVIVNLKYQETASLTLTLSSDDAPAAAAVLPTPRGCQASGAPALAMLIAPLLLRRGRGLAREPRNP